MHLIFAMKAALIPHFLLSIILKLRHNGEFESSKRISKIADTLHAVEVTSSLFRNTDHKV